MKWVILAIALFVVGYTAVMLLYRKPTPAYRPYQDSVDQATVTRLLASGYQRIKLEVERPADVSAALVLPRGATAALALKAPGGLGKELDYALVEKPLLADSFDRLSLPASVKPGAGYALLATAVLGDNQRVINSAVLFRKDRELIIVPLFDPLAGRLEARWKETVFLLRLPEGLMTDGDYELQLLGARESRKWQVSVRP